MAEGTTSSSWESWLGGWVQAAKETSSSAYEFVKKDLAEFSSVVQKETEKAIEKTSLSLSKENTEQATTKVKAGISSFLGNISKALVIPPSDEYVPVKVSADGTTLYDRGKARLHAIQLDASTYVDPPQGSPEQFDMWRNSFDMDQHKGEISEILVSTVEVRALYTKLVPNEVSHAEFWHRYFYRVHQLECDEARKQALMQRADRTHGDSLSWDEEEWSGGEDDDGNQSDWEKMPRPSSQQALSVKTDKPISKNSPQDPNPSSLHSPTVTTSVKSVTLDTDSVQRSGVPAVEPQDDSLIPDKELHSVPDHFGTNISPSLPQNIESLPGPKDVLKELETASNNDESHKMVPESTCKSNSEERPVASRPAYPEKQVSDKSDLLEEDCKTTFPSASNEDQNPSVFKAAAAASSIEQSLPPCDNSKKVTSDENCGPTKDILAAEIGASTLSADDNSSVISPGEKFESTPPPPSNQSASDCIVENKNEKHISQAMNNTLLESKEATQSNNSEPSDKGESNPELAMRVKGDMVVIGETGTASSGSSDAKGLEDDWEEDFDVELTEEDLKAAEDIAKKLGENLDTEVDDWENWD